MDCSYDSSFDKLLKFSRLCIIQFAVFITIPSSNCRSTSKIEHIIIPSTWSIPPPKKKLLGKIRYMIRYIENSNYKKRVCKQCRYPLQTKTLQGPVIVYVWLTSNYIIYDKWFNFQSVMTFLLCDCHVLKIPNRKLL